MRFPIKLPAFALVVFLERLLAKPVKMSDDHCLPRLRTSLSFIFILPVALQLHMNACLFERQEYKGVLCINDRKTDESSKNRLVLTKTQSLKRSTREINWRSPSAKLPSMYCGKSSIGPLRLRWQMHFVSLILQRTLFRQPLFQGRVHRWHWSSGDQIGTYKWWNRHTSPFLHNNWHQWTSDIFHHRYKYTP